MARAKVAGGHVDVRGLPALQRELRAIDKDLPKQLADANQRVARFIVDRATRKAKGIGALQARAARSLAAARQQRVAAIRFGGARHPEAMGAEFGAYRNILRASGRRDGKGRQVMVRGWNQFRPWRGNSTGAGYFLWPTIRDSNDEVIDIYGREIDQLLARVFRNDD